MKYCYYLGAVTFCILLACKNKGADQQSIKPEIKDITEFVYASLTVVSEQTFQSRTSRSGIIKSIEVEKGDEVKRNQTLFTIKPTADADTRLNNALLNQREAEDILSGRNNKLKSLQIELAQLKEQNLIDSSNYHRKKRLWSKGIGSQNELEKSLLSYNASTSRVQSLAIELKQVEITLRNNYEKASNIVSTERKQLDDLRVRSQIDGKVFNVFKEVGELITTQETFAEIGSIENYIVKMNIDESDIAKIQLGDTALIHLEAYPDKTYEAKLNHISDTKDEITQTFLVEGLFSEAPKKLYNGLSGEANILVGRRKDALIIPSEYLLDGTTVLTEQGEIPVRVGVKNLEFVEVLEGIDTSTLIIKP